MNDGNILSFEVYNQRALPFCKKFTGLLSGPGELLSFHRTYGAIRAKDSIRGSSGSNRTIDALSMGKGNGYNPGCACWFSLLHTYYCFTHTQVKTKVERE